MRLSWNWLSEFIDLSPVEGPSGLARLLTARGLEVEGIERLDQGLEKVVTAQILERNPHPQSDRLSLCKVVTGLGEAQEIVCGAQNMKAGDKVALALIGAELPNGLKIAQSKIRGVVSNGMLCSEEELKLKDTSEGILILPPETPLGVPLAKILGRDDTVLSLKLTANRSDCLGHFGMAREVGAALGQKPKIPKTVQLDGRSPIQVSLEAGELSPQFFGCTLSGVEIKPSPQWLVERLEVLGCRSINNVVDASNLVMFELGHPVHTYDADQIRGGKIQVRQARSGEKLTLLDGQTITLDPSHLVIADQEGPTGLAGVMGGGHSEVTDQTRNLFLECAEFNPATVRAMAIQFQRKTEAAYRFERGIDPGGLSFVLARLTALIQEVGGGEVKGGVQICLPSVAPRVNREPIEFGTYTLSDFLGLPRNQPPVTSKQLQSIFEGLDFKVIHSNDRWAVTPPSYRLDIKIKEDLAEEVARSIGLDQIPSTLPTLSSSPVSPVSSRNPLRVMDSAKDSLQRSGLMETVNLAFSSTLWLERFGFSSAVPVLNPFSEEYGVLVPSLLPGLVRNAIDNWHRHFGSESLPIRLFEMRPVFSAPSTVAAQGDSETGVRESLKIAFVISGPRYAEALRSDLGEVDFYDVKAILDRLFADLGTRGVRYQPHTTGSEKESSLFHPGKSIKVIVGGQSVGSMGLMHPAMARDLKLRADLWIAELDWEGISKLSRKGDEQPSFTSWPEFPGIERDFALLVGQGVTADKLCQIALKAGRPLAKSAKVFDVYRGSQVSEGMTSVAVRVIFYDESRSLQESEAEGASARIVEAWKKELGAELRG